MELPHSLALPRLSANLEVALPAVVESPRQLARRQLAQALGENMPIHPQLNRRLSAVISEAVGNPGGMVRAELAHTAATMNGLPERSGVAFACAVEYFHTASLILDDLPAMDDSMERRGRICSHLLHGEGLAILGALALITRAYALLAEVIAAAPHATHVRAHRFVEACVGTTGLVNGQAQDLSYQGQNASGPSDAAVAMRKTAPMIRLALGLPSILAVGSPEDEQTMKALSIYWGLLYQGVDDLIDELPAARSGKTSGRDARLGRPSAVRKFGLAGATRYLARLWRLADYRIARLRERNAAFSWLADFQETFRLRLDEVASGLPVPAEVCP